MLKKGHCTLRYSKFNAIIFIKISCKIDKLSSSSYFKNSHLCCVDMYSVSCTAFEKIWFFNRLI